MNRRTTIVALLAVLAIGVGGGVLGADAFKSSKTVVRQVTVEGGQPASASSALSVNEIYRRTYKGVVRARLENGNTRNIRLTGLDDETLVGAPQEMIAGSVADLKRPDAVIIDKAGYEYM